MRPPIVQQLCLQMEKLHAAFLSLSKNLDQVLISFLELCRPFSSLEWKYVNPEDRLKVFYEAFKFLHEGYLICQRCRTLDAYSESQLKAIFSSLYEVQMFFIEALKINNPCSELSTPEPIARLLLLLVECASEGGLLDPRVGVGLWKFFSNLLQQNIGDLRNIQVCANGADFLDQLLSPLMESTIHFYKCCLREITPPDLATAQSSNTGVQTANLKMLNLLCRIATFCIKEFAAVSLQATLGRTSSSLLTWIIWMVSTRYAGGSNPSGSGLSAELVQHLETSMYLSTDVLLAHMTTVPPPMKQRETECSSAAIWLRSATIQPTVRLRIYAGILLNLPKNPHLYSRWVGEEFNIYSEFFTTCAQINTKIPLNNESKTDTVADSLTALVTEFYTSMLKQVCASICGLPAGCYYYLEQALLRGLLVNHPWTNLFVADVWCFVARYGPGELCWHYVNLFASTIQQMAIRLYRSSSDAETLSERVVMQLDRLGRVLARFLVFLTPKQQSQFFGRYPLSEAALINLSDPATGHQAPLIWRFVPLTLSRLQKPAQTMLEEQLNQRLIGLLRTVENRSLKEDWDIQLTVETALALRFVSSMDWSWKETNAPTIVRLTNYFLTASVSLGDTVTRATTVPCAPVLLSAPQRPLTAISSLVLQWNIPSKDTEMRPFLRWLASCCLKATQSNPEASPLLSFVTLRAWYTWLDCNSLQYSQSYPDWMKTIASAFAYVSLDLVSPVYRPLLANLKQVLSQVSCEHPMDVEDEGVLRCIRQVDDALTQLECKWKSDCSHSSASIQAVRKLNHRFDTFLRNLDVTSQI
ncbi:hypothetical protein CRM22_002465 [Opisthorchis felineus]|uniref:Uncharacterized protein n=1 Tax=Opisthorchis felineus TaxID=147828 RepID=A0A4S2MAC5_OPIFE|nr:hypothetical protein CRM22_002465 [Opisthorchis felineus]